MFSRTDELCAVSFLVLSSDLELALAAFCAEPWVLEFIRDRILRLKYHVHTLFGAPSRYSILPSLDIAGDECSTAEQQ